MKYHLNRPGIKENVQIYHRVWGEILNIMMIGLKVDQQMATITSENPFCAPKSYRVDQYTNILIFYCSTVLIQARAQMSYFRYRYKQKPKHNSIFAENLVLVIEPIEQWFAE